MTKTGSMLRDKPTRSTIPMVAHDDTRRRTNSGDVSVSEAALLLDREQMPCLLIKDGEATFGIMTSGDIVKRSSPRAWNRTMSPCDRSCQTGALRRMRPNSR